MSKLYEKFLSMAIRYFLLIILVVPGLALFYAVFGPPTIHISYLLLDIFYEVSLLGNIIFTQGFPIEIVEACIAGAAYYLLLILNLAIPNVSWKKRIGMIAFSFAIFLLVNVLRIIILTALYVSGSQWFDFAHELFWYVVSIVFVVGIWFWEVKLFKVKEIPFYTDLKFLYSQTHLKK